MKGEKPAVYDHTKIEKKWQNEWEQSQLYKTENPGKKKKMYVLDMFPYPSGVGLHVGHPKGYIGSDIYARLKRMQGFNVLHPMGFDSFGLPAEQYAIQTKKHPGPFTEKLVQQYKKQLEIIGFSYDWSREVATHRPEYYKWTQWIFLKLFDAWYDNQKNKARPIQDLVALFEKKGMSGVDAVSDGSVQTFSAKEWKQFSLQQQQEILMHFRLAYEGFAEVNWCQELGTVLANDEILDSATGPVSERGGYPVVKKQMRQWFMRITAYADRLLENLKELDWSTSVKDIQTNWIGKSEGSQIAFKVKGESINDEYQVDVFTTRADTLFGVTYIVLAPEHPLVESLKHKVQNKKEVEVYITKTAQKDEVLRTSTTKEKTGVELVGVYATNPANGEHVPVWIADYVLASYGTGAVMAVPAHDERDFAFAEKYNLPIRKVVSTGEAVPSVTYGVLQSSGNFNGLHSEEAKKKITAFVGGHIVTKYKMRDAIFARQRYWGEPIPLKHTIDGCTLPLKEKELPLMLPNVKSYEPSGTGESPLAGVSSWVKAGYETNTMPGWAGSSWYFLRYMDPHNTKAFAGKKEIAYWKNVDVYVGGDEHATGHLLYSRFWHQFLYDIGLMPTQEPFKVLKNQGKIGGPDGRKMSKRWGNVINPDDVIKTYGADTLRVYEMFMGPFEASLPWSTESIIGSRRFIEKVWRFKERVVESKKTSKDALSQLHKTIKKVTEDIEDFNFNTAVSTMMICLNEFEKAETVSLKDYKIFLQLLAPFAPHMTDELWQILGEKKSIHISLWPKHNPKLLIEDMVTIAVQINGKVRAELDTSPDESKEAVEKRALEIPRIKEYIQHQKVKKVIVVPGRVINIVL